MPSIFQKELFRYVRKLLKFRGHSFIQVIADNHTMAVRRKLATMKIISRKCLILGRLHVVDLATFGTDEDGDTAEQLMAVSTTAL